MNQLATLQGLDRHLREKTELRQTLEKEVAALDTELNQRREAATAARTQRDVVDARRRDLEARLEDEELKMKDRRMRLNRVRNEKELQALRHEIEVGKESNQQLEEELLGVLEAVDGLTASAAEAERLWTELETTVTVRAQEHRQRMQELDGEIVRDREARQRMAHGLDASLLRKYEQIFARRGGTAVVAVRNGTCQGCHMNLPPQFFNELQKSRDVRLCPNCHRILFWRPESLESNEPER